jgi:hypothetical protein
MRLVVIDEPIAPMETSVTTHRPRASPPIHEVTSRRWHRLTPAIRARHRAGLAAGWMVEDPDLDSHSNAQPALIMLIMRRRFPCLATSPSSWCSGSMRNPYAPPARAYNRVWILWKSLAKSCSPSGRCALCGYCRRITGHKQPGGGRQVPQG